MIHASHDTYVSLDASSYDEICRACGCTDGVFGSLENGEPCPSETPEHARLRIFAAPTELTIRDAQLHQPWTVPYSSGVLVAADRNVPHILASHDILHAAKTVGKLAAVFEELDHTGLAISDAQLNTVRDMTADLVTEALRLANLCGFDLATELIRRVKEKNTV